ncbi:type II toxin-antitoxin system HipA family toxin [Marinobacter salexigens]|uniref:type II toxin-antitoxin system HipA family toxin n=1 Tax=Marinobacter salexigens TaxID=1925763 RepID=UPI000C28C61A|nr:type II toxin-antitoxin system HipA family toxin [Marinobacter salexigens]
MNSELNVCVDGHQTGKLFKETADIVFSYDDNSPPEHFVSLTMPVRRREYSHRYLHPIFEMHLPEGYLLSTIKKQFAKITDTDDLGLLKLLAPSIRGRIEYNRQDQSENNPLHLDTLLHSKNPGLFEELVSRFALRSALSGVQPKVLAQLENKATLRLDDFIIKAWGQDYPALALNEYCCMLACKYAGIPVPEFHLSDDESLFIMKRFDLNEDGSALGFEDMCVLQAKQRDDKYTGSYEQIAKTIKIFVSPANKRASLEQFFKMIVISNALQNGDAHLKNFGLIYENAASIRLAPAYDIVCTTVYISQDIPALTLAGSKKWMRREKLERFGVQACELTASRASALYDECRRALSKLLPYLATRLAQATDHEQRRILGHLQSLIATQTGA